MIEALENNITILYILVLLLLVTEVIGHWMIGKRIDREIERLTNIFEEKNRIRGVQINNASSERKRIRQEVATLNEAAKARMNYLKDELDRLSADIKSLKNHTLNPKREDGAGLDAIGGHNSPQSSSNMKYDRIKKPHKKFHGMARRGSDGIK